MKKEACANCGKEARVITGNYRFDEVGLPVLLKNIEMVDCNECGTREPIIPSLNELMHVLAFAVVVHPCKLKGQHIRFLRKYLGMSADEFSGLVHADRTTLSKWENNSQEIGSKADRLIRFVVVSESAELRKQLEEFMQKYRELTDCSQNQAPQINVKTETLEYEYA